MLIFPLFLGSSLPDTQSTALNRLRKYAQAKCLHATVTLHPRWQLNDLGGLKSGIHVS